MKKHLGLIAFLVPFIVFAQQKGTTPMPASSLVNRPSETYALVIGISDYQDPDIPDLRFADKDAQAFANFLCSPAGGSLDEDHLKVLTNEQATSGQVGAELFWLLDEVKEGDKAIIYFSGHGDVERNTLTQPGYLLCYNAPPRVYMAGGVVALPMFQDVISTLSIQNKAKVVVITDACRSGKLSGSAVGGAQLTSSNLTKQYANEIKILSCQPDEYSIEGEQWGGGRGAFSYHLLDGLYGLADRNNDQEVSLSEIDRYLEDHVTKEVEPQNQLPVTVGNGRELLTRVSPEILAQIVEGKKNQMTLFTSSDSKGLEDEILASVDTSTREQYRLFKQSLKDRQFLEPDTACTDAYFNILINKPGLARLHASMTRNYAAALQDDAQSVLNRWLSTDFKLIAASQNDQRQKYEHYPQYLERAAELLGENHYMYPILQARKLYFEAYLMHVDTRHADRELGEKILAKYRKALEWEPGAAYVYHQMGCVNFILMLKADSAEYYAHKATEAAPTWILPYASLAYYYYEWTSIRNLDRTKHFLELAGQVDSAAINTNLLLINNWANYYLQTGQLQNAVQLFERMLELDSTARYAHSGLGNLYSQSGVFQKSEFHYKKSLELDSMDYVTIINLGILYQSMGKYSEAETLFKRASELDPTSLWPLTMLGTGYIMTGRIEEAEEKISEVFSRDSMFTVAYGYFGYSFFQMKHFREAETYLKKAIKLESNNVWVRTILGGVFLETHRLEDAEEQFTQALELEPNNANIHNSLGIIYWKSNQLENAEIHLKKAISMDSLSKFAYPNLGLVYAQLGRYEEADQLFKKGLELDPDNEKNISMHYAMLYSLQNQLDKAFEYFENSLQLGYKKDDTHIDIMRDPAFAPMRAQTERWDAMMIKYFPEDR